MLNEKKFEEVCKEMNKLFMESSELLNNWEYDCEPNLYLKMAEFMAKTMISTQLNQYVNHFIWYHNSSELTISLFEGTYQGELPLDKLILEEALSNHIYYDYALPDEVIRYDNFRTQLEKMLYQEICTEYDNRKKTYTFNAHKAMELFHSGAEENFKEILSYEMYNKLQSMLCDIEDLEESIKNGEPLYANCVYKYLKFIADVMKYKDKEDYIHYTEDMLDFAPLEQLCRACNMSQAEAQEQLDGLALDFPNIALKINEDGCITLNHELENTIEP